jgi:hypothetical protein
VTTLPRVTVSAGLSGCSPAAISTVLLSGTGRVGVVGISLLDAINCLSVSGRDFSIGAPTLSIVLSPFVLPLALVLIPLTTIARLSLLLLLLLLLRDAVVVFPLVSLSLVALSLICVNVVLALLVVPVLSILLLLLRAGGIVRSLIRESILLVRLSEFVNCGFVFTELLNCGFVLVVGLP